MSWPVRASTQCFMAGLGPVEPACGIFLLTFPISSVTFLLVIGTRFGGRVCLPKPMTATVRSKFEIQNSKMQITLPRGESRFVATSQLRVPRGVGWLAAKMRNRNNTGMSFVFCKMASAVPSLLPILSDPGSEKTKPNEAIEVNYFGFKYICCFRKKRSH